MEFGYTPNLELRTKQWTQIAGSPMRYFADSKVPITVCSFHKTLNWERDRIQLLNHFVQESNLSARETIELLHSGFDQSFQDVKSKITYGQQLWNQWKDLCQSVK